jgi:peptidoglycan/xylan/chitin deacetylase (PgdA/CDA1 family)
LYSVTGQALIITYRGIGAGPGPEFIDRDGFRAHLECLSDCGVSPLTITELAEALRAGTVPPRAVALTFDGGLRCDADEAVPLLAEHEFTATFFCAPGRLGGSSRWPSAHDGSQHELLTGAEVAELSDWGFEVGSCGMEHLRLDALPSFALEREIRMSRDILEEVTGASVESFALPYGVLPGPEGRSLLEETYFAACGGALGTAETGTDLYDLPRVDGHLLRRPGVFRRALVGFSLPPYLRARRAGVRARRMLAPSESVPE